MATTKSAVMTEGLETRRLVASESASTRQHVTSTSNALGEKLGAKIQEGVERMLNSAKQSRGPTTNPGQLAFFSRLMAGFKAVELKELLVAHGVEPVGTKQTFAQLIVENSLTEEDLDAFIASRGSRNKRPRLATVQQRMTSNGQQSTLDSLRQVSLDQQENQPLTSVEG